MLSEGKVSACRVWGRKLLLQPHRQHTSEDTACPEFSFVSLNEKISQSCRAQKLMCFMSQQQHNQTYITRLIKIIQNPRSHSEPGVSFPGACNRVHSAFQRDTLRMLLLLWMSCLASAATAMTWTWPLRCTRITAFSSSSSIWRKQRQQMVESKYMVGLVIPLPAPPACCWGQRHNWAKKKTEEANFKGRYVAPCIFVLGGKSWITDLTL